MDLSIIIPAKDEAESLPGLVAEVRRVLKGCDVTWDLWVVDDGSSDASFGVVSQLAESSSTIHGLSLDRNYGKTTALVAALDRAKGDRILLLDGDGQDDPEDIPRFLEAGRTADSVCGVRRRRRDSRFRRTQSVVAFAVRNAVLRDGVRDTGCGLQLHRREMLLSLPRYEGMHRFLPYWVKRAGASLAQIEVAHRPRLRGESKVPFWRRLGWSIADLLAVHWMRAREIRYEVRDER